jgi:DNA-binding beta-propeller fold protein YncE
MQMARAGVPAGDVWTDPDLANASYDSVSFSVAGQETSPWGIFFKPDGSKMYVTGSAGDDINEYDLGTAWDVSTASFLQRFSVSAQDTNPRSAFFRQDGIKMYFVGAFGDDINEYDLSTAWDVSTASFVQNFSVSAQDTNPSAVFFKPDGTKMYVLGRTGIDVNEYDLSAAWDVSTASFLQSFSVSSEETGPNALFFSPNGDVMFVTGNTGDDINEYFLSTAWDVSTAAYVQNFSVASQETFPTGLFFKSDGSKVYIAGIGGTSTIYQYSTA